MYETRERHGRTARDADVEVAAEAAPERDDVRDELGAQGGKGLRQVPAPAMADERHAALVAVVQGVDPPLDPPERALRAVGVDPNPSARRARPVSYDRPPARRPR
jgi:hypothetical protein